MLIVVEIVISNVWMIAIDNVQIIATQAVKVIVRVVAMVVVNPLVSTHVQIVARIILNKYRQ